MNNFLQRKTLKSCDKEQYCDAHYCRVNVKFKEKEPTENHSILHSNIN